MLTLRSWRSIISEFMSNFILTRELIKRFYSKYEAYVNPVLKFIFSMILLSIINSKMGYMSRIDNIAVVLIVALLCSFLPLQAMALFAGLFILLHMYALAIECAIVVGVMFFLMFILYMRLAPKETLAVLITPILFMLKIPYVMPVAMGLLGTPASVVSVSFGVVAAYVIQYIQANAATITTLEDGNMVSRIRFMVDGLLGNKSMMGMIFVFAIVLILVYTIRRRSIEYSWTIAVITGGLTELILMVISNLSLDMNLSVGGIIVGCILAILVGLFLQLFSFHLDYKKIENVQFEDDDYYYYVKAVPKVTMPVSDKKVKRVHSGSSASRSGQHRTGKSVQTASSKSEGAARTERTVHTANGTSRTMR